MSDATTPSDLPGVFQITIDADAYKKDGAGQTTETYGPECAGPIALNWPTLGQQIEAEARATAVALAFNVPDPAALPRRTYLRIHALAFFQTAKAGALPAWIDDTKAFNPKIADGIVYAWQKALAEIEQRKKPSAGPGQEPSPGE